MLSQSNEFGRKDLSNRIQEHFSLRLERLEKAEPPYQNLTLKQLISQAPLVSSAELESYFGKRPSSHESSSKESVWEALESIRNTLNGFPNEKRFFITETINFFENHNQIETVVSALLSISEPQKQQDILEFAYSTFLTLNKNIETIISSNELISQDSLHLERGGLYSLSTDIARIICCFFEESFLAELDDSDSEIATVQKAFNNFKFNRSSSQNSISHSQVDALLSDPSRLKELACEFISAIQTHDLLLLYAQKRHLYYRLFLKTIIQRIDADKVKNKQLKTVLAGSLLQNPQLDPGSELIEALTSKNEADNPKGQMLYETFVDKLTPTTVLHIINDYKQSLRTILHQPTVKPPVSSHKSPLKSMVKTLLGKK